MYYTRTINIIFFFSSKNNNAVIVDSLLCFLYNFRSLPQINSILINNFSFSSFRRSFELICTFDGNNIEENNKELKNNLFLNEKQQKQYLFEQIIIKINLLINSGKSPIFAASDLHCLPLRPLFYEENNSNNNQLFDELRQIRFLLQDCLLLHKNVESFSSSSSSPTHSINSLINTTTISSPELKQFNSITPINEYPPSLPPPPPTTSPGGFSSINSTPAKGLRISQILQKLTKNKDFDIIENQTKKQLFVNNNNNCGEEITTTFSREAPPSSSSSTTTTTILHPALALMQIQMLGHLASLNNQQKLIQKNNELVEQQQNCLKMFRKENSAFSIYKNNNEIKTTTTTITNLIKPKEELLR
ncbi:hypothetical protein Mgra_00000967 [Meloidogyne graminicola]|uniref:Uncharacterized protein n=1 Tax=Meloidogyne graminicola TaxID=189291 RepID=A0A8T0A268_9BILA|nr:hypothetical protein Mgra_00000967 [Meloidogyne graminicola]